MSEALFRELLERGLDGIARWEGRFAPFEPHASLAVEPETARDTIDALVERLTDNYPFFHPDYAGQMLRPPHPVALAAYAAAARINPNNHALDGGPATARMEHECVDQLATMFGLRAPYLGHLTSSGTIANLEALWVASRLKPGKSIAFSSEAHYTHARMCELLGVQTVVVGVDAHGRLDLAALDGLSDSDRIGTLVLTAGTTATGAIDPIDAALRLARDRGWRIHVDAAYGGFFTVLAAVPEAHLNFGDWKAIADADSVVVDPHKHGLQPYGCGAVLFADPHVGALYRHDSPYTYFTSSDLHLGEISIECSRAGAAAAALWATLRCFPLTADGLGRCLLASRRAAREAYAAIGESATLVAVTSPDLDIIAVAPLRKGERTRASSVSVRSNAIFDRCQNDAHRPMFLAKWRVPKAFGKLAVPDVIWDQQDCTVLRSVLMKPEHEHSARALVERLSGLV